MGGTDASPEDFNSEYQPGVCAPGEVKTAFATQENIDTMKAMLAWANPPLVLRVADEWKHIHDHLVAGGGSVKGDFDKAVDHILQHWEGEAADEFAKRAKKISKQIADCASYAQYTSTAMQIAGTKLTEIRPKVQEIEKPGTVSSMLNSAGDGFTRDDHAWRGAIHDNQGAQAALDKYDDDLSAGKEEQLKTAALMEDLALTYTSQSKAMGSWQRKPSHDYDDNEDYPGEPGGIAPVPVPVTPEAPGPTPGAGTGPGRPPTVGAVPGHMETPPPSPLEGKSPAATSIDAASTTHATNTGSPETVTNAPRTAMPGAGPGTTPLGDVPGGPGLVGKASGNRGAPRTSPGSTSGEHAASSRHAGMHGGGGGAGGGGRGSSGAAGRGPLARQKGGKLDDPADQAKAGGGRSASHGLHSSRGGSEAGQRGSRAGMMHGGGAMGGNAKRREGKGEEGQRPDYLVEDEETWMPKRRDTAPPTVD